MPVFENTKATCGNLLTACSTLSCMACDCVSEVDGIRSAFIAMLFSSSVGMKLRTEPGEEQGRTSEQEERT